MPVQFKIIPEFPLIYGEYQGVVTLPEIVEQMYHIYGAPEYVSGMRELADLSQAEDLDLSDPEIQSLVEEIAWQHSEIGTKRDLFILRPADACSRSLEVFTNMVSELGDDFPITLLSTPTQAVRQMPLAADNLHHLPARFSE